MNIHSIAEEAVRFGEYLGAGEVEAYMMLVDSKKVALTKEIETLYTSIIAGLGVRVIIDKKIGFFATSSVAIRDVRKAAEAAYSMAKLSEPDKEWLSLPMNSGKANVEGIFDREIAEIEPETLIKGAIQIIDSIKKGNERLAIIRGGISTRKVETVIVNSHGSNLFRVGTFATADVSVKAEEGGKKGVSSERQHERNWKDLDFSNIAQIASQRASEVMYSKHLVGGKLPIVWRNKLFASILRIMFRGTLSADSIQKKRSPWAGKVGVNIASKNFNLVDDGLLRAGFGTREFDDDGIPQQKNLLIHQGVLQSFLYDTYTANKEGFKSTGNSSRSYRRLPTPQPNNLILDPGKTKEDELFEDIKKGVYLIETIGEWLSNPISGNLSATGTNAFLIEDGELTKPIKGINISGNFFDILNNKIDLIGNDVKNSGSTYSPSVRIKDMTIIS